MNLLKLVIVILCLRYTLGLKFSIRCLDDEGIDTIKHCIFLQKGTYFLVNVENAKTITYDRLTDSTVIIPDLVSKLIILSSAFDKMEPCEHAITQHNVIVRIDDQDLRDRMCK